MTKGTEARIRAAIIMLAGAVGTVWSIQESMRLSREAHFPRTQATIDTVDIDWFWSSGRHSNRTYEPVLRYTYTVAGQSYVGTRLSTMTPNDASRSKLADRLAKYAAGSVVSAFYDPKDPAQSFLELDSVNYERVIGFCCFLLIGYGFIEWRTAED